MAKYSYNGNVLPEIPSDIVSSYEYLIIATSGTSTSVFGSTKVIYKGVQNNGVNTIIIPGKRVRIKLNDSAQEWGAAETATSATTLVLDGGTSYAQWFLIWSKYNIPDGSATATSIYFEGSEPVPIIEELPTTITYNGNTLAELEEGQTAVFPQDVKAKTDVAIAFGSKGSITYNGKTTEIEKGKTATLLCGGKKFATEVVVAVEKAEDPNDPYGLIGEWTFYSRVNNITDVYKTFNVSYSVEGVPFKSIRQDIGAVASYVSFIMSDGAIGFTCQNSWRNQGNSSFILPPTINITGGSALTDETFANWLKANAVKQ